MLTLKTPIKPPSTKATWAAAIHSNNSPEMPQGPGPPERARPGPDLHKVAGLLSDIGGSRLFPCFSAWLHVPEGTGSSQATLSACRRLRLSWSSLSRFLDLHFLAVPLKMQLHTLCGPNSDREGKPFSFGLERFCYEDLPEAAPNHNVTAQSKLACLRKPSFHAA